MNMSLATSYAHCRQVMRQTATNFHYSFLVLPRAKRRAMYALYAFARLTDDLGDDDLGDRARPLDERRRALADWRRSLERGLRGAFDSPVFPALADTVETYGIPADYLRAIIDGVEMDLDHTSYETFACLNDYCYKVASAVGLCCIHIWGFRDRAAIGPAIACGKAFQMTNILRDLKEDAGRNRAYLPVEDLRRFGYTVDELRRGVVNGSFRQLMRFEIERTEGLYRAAAELDRWLEPDGTLVFRAMTSIYRELLAEIKRVDGDVFTHRIRLTAWRKLRLAGRWLLQHRAHPGRALRAPLTVISREQASAAGASDG
jgi:15-cis-phytoene synthase